MINRKWTIAAAAVAALAVAGGTAGWASADDTDAKALDYVDGLGEVTNDWNDHAEELGGALCEGCDNSEDTDLVVLWQSVLVADEFLTVEDIDGYFGPGTTRATNRWQEHFGVAQTGEVDTETWTEVSSRLRLPSNDGTVYYGTSPGGGSIRFTRADDADGTYRFNKILLPGTELINKGSDKIEHYKRTIELNEV